MADILLIIAGFIVLAIGIVGCVLPVLPGPPISFMALILLHLTTKAQFSTNFLWAMGFIALLVTLLDNIVPIWGTKKSGGSKYGTWGATIGLVIGLFLGPPGILLGPFAGAVIGEMISGRQPNEALRSGIGAFIGFLMGVGLKLMASFLMTFFYFKELILSFIL